ncbi:MAG TPA: AAA family ATPase [Sedimentisphaerales bacterium]|nr:AAA family ATPase [Sedimentisphaerales bacterium]
MTTTDYLSRTDVNQVEPLNLSHIKGQPQVTNALQVYLRAYFNVRSVTGNAALPFGPVLLTGPSGTGKTLVAKAIHCDLGNLRLIHTNGEAINERGALFATLIKADEYTTVLIDEAQGMNARTQRILLTAVSERFLSTSLGSSQAPYTISLDSFTLILATTDEYLLQDALRNRMRVCCQFNYYSVDDLADILRQRAAALRWLYDSPDIPVKVAQRAKGTARIALNRILQTAWQVAKSHDHDSITSTDLEEAFHHLRIDECGLDDTDRRYLGVLAQNGYAPLNIP